MEPLKRVKPFVPQSTLLSIYNSLVQSHFDYCSLVWGNCGKTSSNKLQKLQNRAARVITSSSYDVDVDSLFHKLSWKELHSRRQIQTALMVFKSLNGLVPEYLTSKFVTRNVSNYTLRDSANKLVVTFPRTNYMKNSFSCSGATLWNSLPCNIRESSNLVPRAHVAFGQHQDTELWNNQFPETKILGLPASRRMRGLV